MTIVGVRPMGRPTYKKYAAIPLVCLAVLIGLASLNLFIDIGNVGGSVQTRRPLIAKLGPHVGFNESYPIDQSYGVYASVISNDTLNFQVTINGALVYNSTSDASIFETGYIRHGSTATFFIRNDKASPVSFAYFYVLDWHPARRRQVLLAPFFTFVPELAILAAAVGTWGRRSRSYLLIALVTCLIGIQVLVYGWLISSTDVSPFKSSIPSPALLFFHPLYQLDFLWNGFAEQLARAQSAGMPDINFVNLVETAAIFSLVIPYFIGARFLTLRTRRLVGRRVVPTGFDRISFYSQLGFLTSGSIVAVVAVPAFAGLLPIPSGIAIYQTFLRFGYVGTVFQQLPFWAATGLLVPLYLRTPNRGHKRLRNWLNSTQFTGFGLVGWTLFIASTVGYHFLLSGSFLLAVSFALYCMYVFLIFLVVVISVDSILSRYGSLKATQGARLHTDLVLD